MNISTKAINLIKDFEGFKNKPYLCQGGYKTIGYGHMLKANENLEEITNEQAENLLESDIEIAENIVKRNIFVDLTQGQFDALVSFTFNLGSAALQRSTLRQKVNRNEHDDVPIEFMRWVYANGNILPGLVLRRRAEANLYIT